LIYGFGGGICYLIGAIGGKQNDYIINKVTPKKILKQAWNSGLAPLIPNGGVATKLIAAQ